MCLFVSMALFRRLSRHISGGVRCCVLWYSVVCCSMHLRISIVSYPCYCCTFLHGFELPPPPPHFPPFPLHFSIFFFFSTGVWILGDSRMRIRLLLSVRPTPRGGGGLAEFQGGWVSNPPAPPPPGVGWDFVGASATSFFLLLQVPCNMFIYGVFTWHCISRVHAPRP